MKKSIYKTLNLIPHWQKWSFFSLPVAQILFQYIGNFLSLSAKVWKTTISEQIRDYKEKNYLLWIWYLEELDAERCGCWERPPQHEALTISEVKAMAEGAWHWWVVRVRHPDCSSVLFNLEHLRIELCKWTCCLGDYFTLCEQNLNLSGEAFELNPAAFTKSYGVTECCPSVRWFSRGKTQICPFWMTFAPCINAKMSSHFLKKSLIQKTLIQKWPIQA